MVTLVPIQTSSPITSGVEAMFPLKAHWGFQVIRAVTAVGDKCVGIDHGIRADCGVAVAVDHGMVIDADICAETQTAGTDLMTVFIDTDPVFHLQAALAFNRQRGMIAGPNAAAQSHLCLGVHFGVNRVSRPKATAAANIVEREIAP